MEHYIYTLEIGLTGSYYKLGEFTSKEEASERYKYLVNMFGSKENQSNKQDSEYDEVKPTITRLMLSTGYQGDRPIGSPLAGASMHDFKEGIQEEIIKAYNEKYK